MPLFKFRSGPTEEHEATFRGYRLERLIAREASSLTVYDGSLVSTGERVSVRAFPIPAEPRLRKQFKRAAKKRVALVHPSVLPARAAFEHDGNLYLVTDPTEAPTLADRLKQGPVGPEMAVRMLTQVADGVDAAQATGLTDALLSPAGILLEEPDGSRTVLADLGTALSLAALVQPWAHPHAQYFSPELGAGDHLGARTSVYSVACILFECLTGAPPYGGNWLDLSASHSAEPVPAVSERRPELGTAIDSVIARALAQDPGDRFSSPGELMQAAAAALEDAKPSEADPATAAPSLPVQGETVESREAENSTAERAAATAQAPGEAEAEREAQAAAEREAEAAAEREAEQEARAATKREEKAAAQREAEAERRASAAAKREAGQQREAATAAKREAAAAAKREARQKRDAATAAKRDAKVKRKAEAAERRAREEASREEPAPPAVSRPAPSTKSRPTQELGSSDADGERAAASRRHGGSILLGVVLLALLALGGYLLGSAGTPDTAPAERIAAGPLSIRIPADWERRSAAGVLPGTRLSMSVAAGPQGSRNTGIVAGRDSRPGNDFLPTGMAPPPGRSGQPVRLGRFEAYRHSGLRAASSPQEIVAFSIPVADGAAVVACHAPPRTMRGFSEACERVASTIDLKGLKTVRLSTIAQEKRRTAEILTELRRRRAAGRRQLSAARTPTGQSRAARRLQAAYGDARGALGKPSSNRPSSSRQAQLPTALERVEESYRLLGRAARARSRTRYGAARQRVDRSEAALIRLLSRPPA